MTSSFVISNGIYQNIDKVIHGEHLPFCSLYNPFLPLLEGSYEKLFSDSQSACKIIQVGSMRSDLHAIAAKIFQFYASNGTALELQWIPRIDIEKADYISRVVVIDDWQILADCFHVFRGKLGRSFSGLFC